MSINRHMYVLISWNYEGAQATETDVINPLIFNFFSKKIPWMLYVYLQARERKKSEKFYLNKTKDNVNFIRRYFIRG